MSPVQAAVERVARESYGWLLAHLAVRSRDIMACEDALSEAFAAALHKWPERGVPDNPRGWLFTVARNRLHDDGRRRGVRQRAVEAMLMRMDEPPSTDERLPLMFACTHPAIDGPSRTPLMLQVVLGLDAATIASAFLLSPASMAKRLVRAKQKIKAAGVPFEVPERDEWGPRLRSVLDATYAAYGQHWDLGGLGGDATDALRQEALYLADLVALQLPDEPEALGLRALLCYVEARSKARVDDDGQWIPLDEQDVSKWDEDLLEQGEAALKTAAKHATAGRYQLEAAIQSCHVARRRDGVPNWDEVERLYHLLLETTGTLGAFLGYTVAVANHRGAKQGLSLLDRLNDPRLRELQTHWAVRADLLRRLGRNKKAKAAYRRALALTQHGPARLWLERRLAFGLA